MELETIKVVCAELESGFMIINKSDFDPETMVEFSLEPSEQDAHKASKKAK